MIISNEFGYLFPLIQFPDKRIPMLHAWNPSFSWWMDGSVWSAKVSFTIAELVAGNLIPRNFSGNVSIRFDTRLDNVRNADTTCLFSYEFASGCTWIFIESGVCTLGVNSLTFSINSFSGTIHWYIQWIGLVSD